jgi:mannose-6-phosphate isomerase-like protein (cupin superfamily)
MSDYAIWNFNEDEPANPEAEREGRFARSHIDSEHVGVSYFRYAPGHRAAKGHSHREQEEVYVVISGSGRVKLGDDIKDLKQWDVVRVAPSTVRAFEGGPDGMELIVAANDRPAEGDGVLAEDFWPAGQ